MTDFSRVAAALGSAQPWIFEELARCAKLIAMPRLREDVTVEAELLASAHYLRDWLPILYGHAYELIGEEPPEVVEDTLMDLDDLIPLLERDLLLSVDASKGGPKPDRRKRLCALVCASIWRKHRGKAQPYSTELADACEAYWRACGHVELDPTDWEHYLSHP
jgi:hypothetical protein